MEWDWSTTRMKCLLSRWKERARIGDCDGKGESSNLSLDCQLVFFQGRRHCTGKLVISKGYSFPCLLVLSVPCTIRPLRVCIGRESLATWLFWCSLSHVSLLVLGLQQKNTCAHNSTHKAHANGIKKAKRTKYVSTRGMDPKFLRNQKFAKKYNGSKRVHDE